MKEEKTITHQMKKLFNNINKGLFEYKKDLKTMSDSDLWDLCEFDETETHIKELKKRFQERPQILSSLKNCHSSYNRVSRMLEKLQNQDK